MIYKIFIFLLFFVFVGSFFSAGWDILKSLFKALSLAIEQRVERMFKNPFGPEGQFIFSFFVAVVSLVAVLQGFEIVALPFSASSASVNILLALLGFFVGIFIHSLISSVMKEFGLRPTVSRGDTTDGKSVGVC